MNNRMSVILQNILKLKSENKVLVLTIIRTYRFIQ